MSIHVCGFIYSYSDREECPKNSTAGVPKGRRRRRRWFYGTGRLNNFFPSPPPYSTVGRTLNTKTRIQNYGYVVVKSYIFFFFFLCVRVKNRRYCTWGTTTITHNRVCNTAPSGIYPPYLHRPSSLPVGLGSGGTPTVVERSSLCLLFRNSPSVLMYRRPTQDTHARRRQIFATGRNNGPVTMAHGSLLHV